MGALDGGLPAWLPRWLQRLLASALFSAALGSPVQADLDKALGAVEQGDFATALEILQPLAEQGDEAAQYHLSEMVRLGQGLAPDPVKSEEWLRRAAAAGYPLALYQLGYLYSLGSRVYGSNLPEDLSEAALWYQKAAEAGHGEAGYKLAALYFAGLGVDQDEAAAYRWYLVAAELGHADAQHKISEMSRHGWGSEPDMAAAMMWLRRAADQGHVGAAADLARAYERGEGVEADPAQAFAWYRLVEEKADRAGAVPLASLALINAEGRGTAKDAAAALKYFIAHGAVLLSQCDPAMGGDGAAGGAEEPAGPADACTAIDPFYQEETRTAYQILDFDQQQAAAKAARSLLEGFGEAPKETEERVFQVMLEFEERLR